jgi:hypothetical protein
MCGRTDAFTSSALYTVGLSDTPNCKELSQSLLSWLSEQLDMERHETKFRFSFSSHPPHFPSFSSFLFLILLLIHFISSHTLVLLLIFFAISTHTRTENSDRGSGRTSLQHSQLNPHLLDDACFPKQSPTSRFPKSIQCVFLILEP